ncbi:cell division protein anillin-domain-containing protein [Aspergillus pseudonomiae]|uniref:Cell division protein anillin-domain-containing protein n=1 Tax=Aspergillus pseudonomiae TaxID=1506151 RepID=A0A5N7DMG9_9EURO|nr:cell division protein anillin-domain-containing protein [Aspergillus pseudonomiae]KAE8407657.1 cell division protein anillin-domain-containing protein [Aspergillus pseudonomiae]
MFTGLTVVAQMARNSTDAYDVKASPRLFWQGRESGSPFPRTQENQVPYDPESPFSSSKRPSIENLKRQSRVRNSNMLRDYNQEYDPTNVYVPHRPLATTRSPQKEAQSTPTSQMSNRQETGPVGPRPPSPSKEQAPPAKSSLSRASRFGVKDMGFDPENEIWSDADNRHAKSVTFDAAPPQVNEYEMTTPDPSSIASDSREGSYESDEDEFPDISFDRDSLTDREDSFDASLEDLEKTPVVLPEDWRYMSPSSANDELVKEDEDPFTEDEESHNPDPRPSSRQETSEKQAPVESVDSNGEPRPLPPLPGRTSFPPQPSSPSKLASAFELGSGGQRVLPSPPGPASYSKSEITEFGHSSMPLEDRLRLMMIQENGQEDVKPEHQDIEVHSKHDDDEQDGTEPHSNQPEQQDTEATDEAPQAAPEVFSPPHISRDDILRDLRRSESFMDDSFDESSQIPSSPHSYMNYDPDVPIPSLENDDDMLDDGDDYDDTNSVIIKQEEEHENDLYDIPDYYGTIPSKDSSFKSLKDKLTSDDESRYSSQQMEDDLTEKGSSRNSDAGKATPVPADQDDKALCEATPQETQAEPAPGSKMSTIKEALQRPVTPEDDGQISEPSTPDSVIRHPIDDDSDTEVLPEESVPDPIATVKAPGTGLKTRPSLTPADLESMAATRRRISGQHPPPMPGLTKQQSNESEHSAPEDTTPSQPAKDVSQRQSSLVKLDIPFSIQEESLGFGLDKEFDRVIENQKRGYLMRHNTKVIIASSRNEDEPATAPGAAPADSRGTKSAIPTPRKASQQTWTTVPWNGQTRRASIRQASGIRKKPVPGPVPPLPGQQSNVQENPATIEENEPALNGALDEGEERGRLFVKVVGMKYLDLPLPRGERSYFSLTLDNGLHCVTTAWLELGKTAPVGQEFELIVQNDLEFQLTLQMKVDDEKFRVQEPPPTASPARQKTSTFSRVFASPRKRKELDMKHQLASQQQKSKDVNAGVWERLRTLIARDGSFARAYVALSDHEKHAFGRPYTVDVACFNEWAVEDQPSSVKSKKSTSSATSQRRPPYKIGKLELQLLFVPKPKGAKDDDMPKSMNACIREMREAESVSSRSWEGFLSQQGGDCPFWRRRFFKLQGSKLTAYHETTRQPRATINLSKAAKLIDDRSSLMQKETTTKGGGRRKSAFAEEEEGYMFVEEGFRIRFGNGEVIDFYADSAADKEGWMKVLADAVGKGSSGSSQVKQWTELVLKRERSVKTRRETTDRRFDGPPPPPVKKDKDLAPPPTSTAPAPAAAPPRAKHRYTQSQPEVRSADTRRQKARSLIF